jgi:hypothetical protein
MNTEGQDSLVTLLDERIRRISREVVEEERAKERGSANSHAVDGPDGQNLREALRQIMSKEFISVREARLLLGCSDGHIRNLVDKARKGKTTYPIPFLDLDGVSVFPRVKLLEWAERPKRKLRAAS